jgi:hypothetical protein
MYINRIYVDHVALAWSLADSVKAQRTAAIGGNPLVRLLRWLRKGGPIVGRRWWRSAISSEVARGGPRRGRTIGASDAVS